MGTKIDTTTKSEVVDKLHKLQDAIDRRAAAQMDDDSMTMAAVDRLEARVIKDCEAIDMIIDLLEAYQDDVFPDAADQPAQAQPEDGGPKDTQAHTNGVGVDWAYVNGAMERGKAEEAGDVQS